MTNLKNRKVAHCRKNPKRWRIHVFQTRRERLKSALYLRLKKRKSLLFLKKTWNSWFFSFRKCRIVPKNVNLWALLTYILLQNSKKLERGTLLIHQTIFKKKSHNAEKIERHPLVSSALVGYVKIVKNERGDPFAVISADRTWPYSSSF